MSTKTRGFEFTVVKAEGLKPKERKKSHSKWAAALIAMKKLNVGDYIVAARHVEPLKVYQKIANVKHAITRYLKSQSSLPNRKFEFKGLPEASEGGTGYQIIIRRTA